MSKRTPDAPATNRMAMGQVLVCCGCCCGHTDKGHPAVPVDWLKAEWKRRRLQNKIHLSISGCLGPCDQSNVVTVVSPEGSIWLGGIECFDQYRELLDWASACDASGEIRPLPVSLRELEFERFSETGATREEVA